MIATGIDLSIISRLLVNLTNKSLPKGGLSHTHTPANQPAQRCMSASTSYRASLGQEIRTITGFSRGGAHKPKSPLETCRCVGSG